MAFGKKKTLATITEPLGGMVESLNTYADEQKQRVVNLNATKDEIDTQIGVAEDETSKSVVTAKNLKTFMDPTKIIVTKEAVVEADVDKVDIDLGEVIPESDIKEDE